MDNLSMLLKIHKSLPLQDRLKQHIYTAVKCGLDKPFVRKEYVRGEEPIKNKINAGLDSHCLSLIDAFEREQKGFGVNIIKNLKDIFIASKLIYDFCQEEEKLTLKIIDEMKNHLSITALMLKDFDSSNALTILSQYGSDDFDIEKAKEIFSDDFVRRLENSQYKNIPLKLFLYVMQEFDAINPKEYKNKENKLSSELELLIIKCFGLGVKRLRKDDIQSEYHSVAAQSIRPYINFFISLKS